MLAWAGESQYYTEPKRLAKLGYLSARKQPGKTRERTVYALTDRGLDALREYARTPVSFTPVKSDALLRLLICDLVGEEVTRESVSMRCTDLADIATRLDDAERRAKDLHHREKYLLLVTGFLHRFLELHEELLDDVERELAAEAKPRPRQPRDAARSWLSRYRRIATSFTHLRARVLMRAQWSRAQRSRELAGRPGSQPRRRWTLDFAEALTGRHATRWIALSGVRRVSR